MAQLVDEELTGSIIGAFFEVYNTLGFGFLEHVYKMALERELITRGHHVGREVGVRVMYKGEELSHQRLDMIVDGRVIVEIKSTVDLHKSARRQVYNYLKATNLEVGLLLHFGPKAVFYREIRSNPKKFPLNPSNPPNRCYDLLSSMPEVSDRRLRHEQSPVRPRHSLHTVRP